MLTTKRFERAAQEAWRASHEDVLIPCVSGSVASGRGIIIEALTKDGFHLTNGILKDKTNGELMDLVKDSLTIKHCKRGHRVNKKGPHANVCLTCSYYTDPT